MIATGPGIVTCRSCYGKLPMGEAVTRSFVQESSPMAPEGREFTHTFYFHYDCDENATPEQLNAIRDAILGE